MELFTIKESWKKLIREFTINTTDGISTESRIVAALKKAPEGLLEGTVYPSIEEVKNVENIFEKIKEYSEAEDCCALFDAGALFKDMKNIEVATRLKNMKTTKGLPMFDAVLYFHDEENKLYYIDQNNNDPQLAPMDDQFKVMKEKYGKGRCFLYLDQPHTIGTDIKLNNNRATCITTVSNLLNIKNFLQALLRARQLLEGI